METMVPGALVAEAKTAPVKNAFRLGWEFFLQNKTLCYIGMGVLLLLQVLEMIPLVGFFASVAMGVYLQSIQIFTGKAFYRSADVPSFIESLKGTEFQTFAMRYVQPAMGAWLGWFLFSLLLVLIFVVMLMVFGVSVGQFAESMNDEQQMAELIISISGAMLPGLLLALLLSYVFPIVQGKVILSETLGEAFNAVFSMFSPSVWRSAMQADYFRFALLFGALLIGLSFAAGILMAILILIPFLCWIALFVGMIFAMFVLVLILSLACVLAKEIALPAQSAD